MEVTFFFLAAETTLKTINYNCGKCSEGEVPGDMKVYNVVQI